MIGIVSAQKIGELSVSINTALTALMTTDESMWRKIAFVDDGSQTDGQLLGRTVGETVRFPFSPVVDGPTEWAYGTAKGESQEIIISCDVTMKRHKPEGGDKLLYTTKGDPYGVLVGKQGMIINRAGMLPDYEIAKLLNLNGVCGYDGLSFFNTAHLVDPTDAAKGSWSNDVTCTDGEWASGAGHSKLLDALCKVKWMDGQAKDSMLQRPSIICPDENRAVMASQFVSGSMIPRAIGSAAASASNPYLGRFENVFTLNALNNNSATGDVGKYVYAVAAPNPIQAGIIVVPAQLPLFYVSGLDPSDEIRRKQGAVAYGWEAYIGVALGLPHMIVRMKIG